MFNLYIMCKCTLPFVTICKQFLLVVQKFLSCLCRKFKIGTFYDSIDRARLLAKPTVDTFGHINIITCRLACVVRAWRDLDGDRLRGAHGLTQLTSYTTLLA